MGAAPARLTTGGPRPTTLVVRRVRTARGWEPGDLLALEPQFPGRPARRDAPDRARGMPLHLTASLERAADLLPERHERHCNFSVRAIPASPARRGRLPPDVVAAS